MCIGLLVIAMFCAQRLALCCIEAESCCSGVLCVLLFELTCRRSAQQVRPRSWIGLLQRGVQDVQVALGKAERGEQVVVGGGSGPAQLLARALRRIV
jgi:hypothetical protein